MLHGYIVDPNTGKSVAVIRHGESRLMTMPSPGPTNKKPRRATCRDGWHGTCWRINRAGPPCRDGVPLESCPAKCVAPAFETSRARGLFWRLARAKPISPTWSRSPSPKRRLTPLLAQCLSKATGFAQTNERGERLIWLPRGVVAKLRAMRGRRRAIPRNLEACGRGGGSVRLTRICSPRQL
jgi:hypothetical protein